MCTYTYIYRYMYESIHGYTYRYMYVQINTKRKGEKRPKITLHGFNLKRRLVSESILSLDIEKALKC